MPTKLIGKQHRYGGAQQIQAGEDQQLLTTLVRTKNGKGRWVKQCGGEEQSRNGQTVEVTTVKEGGPSRDWLNAELGFLASHRAKAKVRAWFNEQVRHETIARGRESVRTMPT